VLQTANSLNHALLTPGDSSAGLSDWLYQALVTGLVGSDPLVYGAVIVFDPVHAGDKSSSSARRAPYVFRNSTTYKLQVCYRLRLLLSGLNHLTPTVAIWVQLYSIL